MLIMRLEEVLRLCTVAASQIISWPSNALWVGRRLRCYVHV